MMVVIVSSYTRLLSFRRGVLCYHVECRSLRIDEKSGSSPAAGGDPHIGIRLPTPRPGIPLRSFPDRSLVTSAALIHFFRDNLFTVNRPINDLKSFEISIWGRERAENQIKDYLS